MTRSVLVLAGVLAALPVQAQPSSDRPGLGWLEPREGPYEDDVSRWQYPDWAYEQVRDTGVEREFDLHLAHNPFLLHGDFDGDGATDVAAWVVRRSAPDSTGVVVVHRAGGVHAVGVQRYSLPPLWRPYPRGEVGQGVGEGPPPVLVGDALHFEKPGSSSWLWYWDGAAYVEYWQGD